MSKIKKYVSVTMAVLFILAIFPTVAFSAENGITQRINELRTVYDTDVTGIYFTSDGKAEDGIENYRCMLGNVPARGNLPSGREVGNAIGRAESYSCIAFANYAFYYIFGTYWGDEKSVSPSSASYGDFVQINRKYMSGEHYGIYITEDSDYIYIYNGNGNDSKNEVTYKDRYSKSRWKITDVRHAANYDEVANNGKARFAVYDSGDYITKSAIGLMNAPEGTPVFEGEIPADTRLKVTEVSGEWGKTTYKNHTGWISLAKTKKATNIYPSASEQNGTQYVTKDALNFRKEPKLSAGIHFVIPKDTTVTVTEIQDSWGKITYQGKTGWISLPYCSKAHEVEWRVVDVSVHNELTAEDWAKIKKSGVQAAIIRVGGRTPSKELYPDDLFLEHYKNAKAVGLRIGVYFFSYALTREHAVEEAQTVIKALRDNNCQIDMPVFIDMEDYLKDTQHEKATKATCSMVTDVFCKTIEDAGYYAGYYGSKAFTATHIDPLVLHGRAVWIAQYNDECTYNANFDMWQYTETGVIEGVRGYLDFSQCYVNYPNIIANIADVTFEYGDVDGSGTINAADARLALRAAVGLTSLSKAGAKAADIDGNGTVSAIDARYILRLAVGLEKANELYASFFPEESKKSQNNT